MSTVSVFNKLIGDLEAQVNAELADTSIRPDKHGRPIGYRDGCKGPLCLKNHRDRLRKPGQVAANPWADAYLDERLAQHKEALKQGEKVA